MRRGCVFWSAFCTRPPAVWMPSCPFSDAHSGLPFAVLTTLCKKRGGACAKRKRLVARRWQHRDAQVGLYPR